MLKASCWPNSAVQYLLREEPCAILWRRISGASLAPPPRAPTNLFVFPIVASGPYKHTMFGALWSSRFARCARKRASWRPRLRALRRLVRNPYPAHLVRVLSGLRYFSARHCGFCLGAVV